MASLRGRARRASLPVYTIRGLSAVATLPDPCLRRDLDVECVRLERV